MLAKAAKPSRNFAERQSDSQDNSLAAGIEHSPAQLIGENLDQNKRSTDGTVLDHPQK